MAGVPEPEPAETRIMEVAVAHIQRFGLRRFTIVAVAEDVGMSHANIYRYFPSKAALIEALTRYWLRPVEAGLRDIADGPDPAYDKLERMLSALHRAYREKLDSDEHLFSIFAEAELRSTGVARGHRNRIRGEIQRVIEEGMASGSFRVNDQRRALFFVFDALFRFIHPVPLRLDKDLHRAQITLRFDRVLQLVLRAMVNGIK